VVAKPAENINPTEPQAEEVKEKTKPASKENK